MATLTTSWTTYKTSSFSTGAATVTFYLQAKYSSQSTSNNTTNVQTRLRSAITSGNAIAGAGYKFTCSYASTVSGSGTWTFGNEVITSGSKTITHSSDGTKSITISASAYNKYWNFTKSMSTTVSLPTIKRLATVSSGTNFNDEGNPTVTFSNPAGFNLLPYLNFYESSSSGSYLLQVLGTTSSYSSPHTWNLTSSQRQTIRNTLTGQSTYYVTEGMATISGSTNIGSSSVGRTFTFVNANPTFNVAYLDTNSTTTAVTNNNKIIIRNKSTLQINVTNATALKGASLTSITCNLNGVTYTGTLSSGSATFNIGTVNSSSNLTATLKLTDSRGLVTTKTLTIQIWNWELPSATISAQRESNYYDNTAVTVNASYSSLNGNNTLTIQARYKKTTESSYSSYTTLTNNVETTFSLGKEYNWNLQILLTDLFGSKTYNLVIERGMPIIFFDRLKRSVGINCFPTDTESLEVKNGTNQSNIIAGNTYSTSEVDIGKIWIDGKPLYRKTISFTTTSNSYTFTTQSLDITDIDTIMLDSSHSYIKTASNLTYSWNALRPSGDGTLMNFNAVSWLRCNGSNINYAVGSGLTSCSAVVTVEYTKTTD